jgi:hypothetical protein
MLKLAGWVAKIVVGAALVSAICVYTTWYAVNLYIGQIMKQFHLQASLPSFELSDFVAAMVKPSPTEAPAGAGAGATAGSGAGAKSAETPAKQPVPAGNEYQDVQQAPPKTVDQTAPPEDAIAVWGQVSTNQQSTGGSIGQQVERERVVLSAADFQKKKDLISNEDKLKIFTLVMNRIPAEDVQALSEYVENGITDEEVRKIEELVKTRLKPEEYEQILSIINKY